MIVYLLKCALTLTVLYALYGLTLRRETLHSMSRRVLLAILFLSMLLPMVPLRLSHSTMLGESLQEVEQWETEGVQVSRALPAAVRQGEVARERVEASPTGHVSQWITLGYGLVAAGLLLRYAASVVALLRMVRRSRPLWRAKGVEVKMNDTLTSPVSWMRWILLSPADVCPQPSEAGEAAARRCLLPATLLRHEWIHIRRGHSWDRLLCDVTACVLWFCPFVWLLRADLIAVHEYEADAGVLRRGERRDTYIRLLLEKAQERNGAERKVPFPTPAQCFNAGQLRRRLRMMYMRPSAPGVAFRVWLLLPLTVLLVVAMARPSAVKAAWEAQSLEDWEPVVDTVLYVPPKDINTIPETDKNAPSATAERVPGMPIADTDRSPSADNPTAAAPSQPERAKSSEEATRGTADGSMDDKEAEGNGTTVTLVCDTSKERVVYMVNGLRVKRDEFQHYATLKEDAAHHGIRALGKAGVTELSAWPRNMAREKLGVDAPVLQVKTVPAVTDSNPKGQMVMEFRIAPKRNIYYTVFNFGDYER